MRIILRSAPTFLRISNGRPELDFTVKPHNPGDGTWRTILATNISLYCFITFSFSYFANLPPVKHWDSAISLFLNILQQLLHNRLRLLYLRDVQQFIQYSVMRRHRKISCKVVWSTDSKTCTTLCKESYPCLTTLFLIRSSEVTANCMKHGNEPLLLWSR